MATIGPSISFSSVGPSGSPDIAYSNFYVVAQTPWGIDGKATVCSSYADWLRQFGGRNKITAITGGTAADVYTTETTDAVIQADAAVQGYFNEKGSNSPGVLFATRVVASSAGPTAASKSFPDSVGTNNTTVTSKWKGTSGGTTQVTVINPSPRKGVLSLQAGTLAVTSGAAAVAGTGTAFVTGATWVGWGIKIGVNYYTILSVASATALTLASNAIATETIAPFSVGTNTSFAYVKLVHPQAGIVEEWDIGTASDAANVSRLSQLAIVTLPAGGQLPVTAAASKLTTGTAATADTYAATAADYVGLQTAAGVNTGLLCFSDLKLATGLVAIPGQTNATVRAGIKQHAEQFYRVGILGPSAGLNLTTAQSEYAGIASNFLAGYAPRLWVSDANSASNGQLLIDNVGHIAGLCSRMDRDYGGPHKSPAGRDHSFSSVIDVERQSVTNNEIFDDGGSALLADSYVNTIRVKGAVTPWGLRTFASDERYRQINVARTVCLVYHSCFQLMEKITFEPIDPFNKLFSRMKGDLDSFFLSLHIAGALFGDRPGPDPKSTVAWFVVCDRTNNPNISIGKGEVRADVSFVPTLNAEKITLPIMVASPGFGAAAAGV